MPWRNIFCRHITFRFISYFRNAFYVSRELISMIDIILCLWVIRTSLVIYFYPNNPRIYVWSSKHLNRKKNRWHKFSTNLQILQNEQWIKSVKASMTYNLQSQSNFTINLNVIWCVLSAKNDHKLNTNISNPINISARHTPTNK